MQHYQISRFSKKGIHITLLVSDKKTLITIYIIKHIFLEEVLIMLITNRDVIEFFSQVG